MKTSTKVYLFCGALVAYCLIGTLVALLLEDKVPIFFIAVLNYGVAAMVFGPILPLVFDEKRS